MFLSAFRNANEHPIPKFRIFRTDVLQLKRGPSSICIFGMYVYISMTSSVHCLTYLEIFGKATCSFREIVDARPRANNRLYCGVLRVVVPLSRIFLHPISSIVDKLEKEPALRPDEVVEVSTLQVGSWDRGWFQLGFFVLEKAANHP